MSYLHTRSAYEIGQEAAESNGRRDPMEFLITPDSPDGDEFLRGYDEATVAAVEEMYPEDNLLEAA